MTRAMSLRLPDSLKTEASGYADALGISVNALLAVALRDYLDARRVPVAEVRGGLPPESVAKPAERTVPKVAKNQPCPCGSGRKYGKCHGIGGAP